MFDPSWEKLLIVLVIGLIVLGPKKLPEVGRSLGHGIREFKDGVTGRSPVEQLHGTDSAEGPAGPAAAPVSSAAQE
jgi:sec-independent protein translocase protein TatA